MSPKSYILMGTRTINRIISILAASWIIPISGIIRLNILRVEPYCSLQNRIPPSITHQPTRQRAKLGSVLRLKLTPAYSVHTHVCNRYSLCRTQTECTTNASTNKRPLSTYIHTHAHIHTRKHARAQRSACLPVVVFFFSLSLSLYIYIYALSGFLSVCLSVSIRLSVRSPVRPCVCPSVSIRLSVRLYPSVRPSVSIHLSVRLSLSVCLSARPPARPSFCLRVCR